MIDNKTISKTHILILSVLTLFSIIPIGLTIPDTSKSYSSSGYITNYPVYDIEINSNYVIKSNVFSVGTAISFDWTDFRTDSQLRQLASQAEIKHIRFMSYLVEPCTYWNDATRSGSFNWARADQFVQQIIDVGAIPMVTLGIVDGSGVDFPPGMQMDPVTGLPNPDSFSAYCVEWVKHFKNKIKYFEVVNEAWFYFYPNWNWRQDRVNYFLDLYETCYDDMHREDPSILISNDASLHVRFFNQLVQNNVPIDYLVSHKYDCDNMRMSTSIVLGRAETRLFTTDSLFYGVNHAREIWSNKYGKYLPAIFTESNWAAFCSDGSDPRMQQIEGATWLGLVLRQCILEGVEFHDYFNYVSSKSWEQAKGNPPTGGVGFGQINSDNNQPWFPYYVNKMIGTNIDVGDQVIYTSSSSPNLRTVGWINNGNVNILVISKSQETRTLRIQGIEGEIEYQKIDGSISWQNPYVKTGTIGDEKSLTINGYSVILLQYDGSSQTPPPLPPPPTPPPTTNTIFSDGYESGNYDTWRGTISSTGETATIVTNIRHHGTYGSRFQTDGDGGYENAYNYINNDPLTNIHARAYVRVTQSGINQDNDRIYFIRFRSNNDNLAYAGWRMENGVVRWNILYRDGTEWIDEFSTTQPNTNQGYIVELRWKKSSTNGIIELYVNGAKIISATGVNTDDCGFAEQTRFGIAETYNCDPTTVYGDCVAISDSYIGLE